MSNSIPIVISCAPSLLEAVEKEKKRLGISRSATIRETLKSSAEEPFDLEKYKRPPAVGPYTEKLSFSIPRQVNTFLKAAKTAYPQDRPRAFVIRHILTNKLGA